MVLACPRYKFHGNRIQNSTGIQSSAENHYNFFRLYVQCQQYNRASTPLSQNNHAGFPNSNKHQHKIASVYTAAVSTMSLSSKKRKTVDPAEEGDESEYLQKMELLFEALKIEIGESAEKSEALLKSFLIETNRLCGTNAFNRSLTAIFNDVVDDDDDDGLSDDETPIESIACPREKKWAIMFQQLRDYRILNGDCKVPSKFPQNRSLGIWLGDQKQNFVKSKLKPERIIKLESLGICWGKKYPPLPSWNDMFEKLLNFLEKMGNCNIPFNSTNPTALAKWAAYQRMEYKRFKKGRDSLLTLDEIGKLKEIGFNWKGPKL